MSLPLTFLLILTQFGYAVSRDKAFSFLSLFLNVTQISIAYCFSYCRAVPLNVELEASALIINIVLSYENSTANEGLTPRGTCAKHILKIWVFNLAAETLITEIHPE